MEEPRILDESLGPWKVLRAGDGGKMCTYMYVPYNICVLYHTYIVYIYKFTTYSKFGKYCTPVMEERRVRICMFRIIYVFCIICIYIQIYHIFQIWKVLHTVMSEKCID